MARGEYCLFLRGKSVHYFFGVRRHAEILNKTEYTDNENLELKVRIISRDGGIGDIRIYHNGTAISDTKGFRHQNSNSKGVIKTYQIKLVKGENRIKAIAFDSTNSESSKEAILSVNANIQTIVKPNIYALTIGIAEFRNPTLKLDYPQKDAKLFTNIFKSPRGWTV